MPKKHSKHQKHTFKQILVISYAKVMFNGSNFLFFLGVMKIGSREENGTVHPRRTRLRELAMSPMSPDLNRPKRLDLLLDAPPISKQTRYAHSWNPDDRSLNIFVKVSFLMSRVRKPSRYPTWPLEKLVE